MGCLLTRKHAPPPGADTGGRGGCLVWKPPVGWQESGEVWPGSPAEGREMSSSTPLPLRSLTESSVPSPTQVRSTYSQPRPICSREVAEAPAHGSGGNPVTRNRATDSDSENPTFPFTHLIRISGSRPQWPQPHLCCGHRWKPQVSCPTETWQVKFSVAPSPGRKCNSAHSSCITDLSECFLAILK